MREGDKDTLASVLYECVAAGMPELDSDIKMARGALLGMEYSPAGGGFQILYEIVYLFLHKAV